jgi:hypothetical protein
MLFFLCIRHDIAKAVGEVKLWQKHSSDMVENFNDVESKKSVKIVDEFSDHHTNMKNEDK